MNKNLAAEIWQNGWFQAFLDNPNQIPKNIRKDWQELQEICDRIQPKVDKHLEKHPWSILV